MFENAENFCMKLRFILLGHILNPLWQSRTQRRKRREHFALQLREHYLRKYIPFIKNLKGDAPESSESTERLFSIWFQGEENAPAIVKRCFASQRKLSCLEQVVLDDKTLFDWITLPDYIMEKRRKGAIGAAHFADICRVELLYRYGGVWMDATDLMVTEFPQWMLESDFFIYMAGENVGGSYSYVQNCFFRSKRGSLLIKMWRDAIFEYWKNENGAIDYFFHQILFKVVVHNNEEAKRHFERMPKLVQDPTHTIWYKLKDEPFDKAEYERLCREAVFQKTDYRSSASKNPKPGSFADYIINEKV